MNMILEFLRTDLFLFILVGVNFLLLILYIVNVIRLGKIKRNYMNFIKKLGKGENIEEILKKYIQTVEDVDQRNDELINYCKKIDQDMTKCIQKIGMVRYSAFKDTGSDLSFALALLDEENDGVVLNGIYSREMSNIYAKPIEKGKSTYTVSVEEQQAIQKAIEGNNVYRIKD